MAGPGPRADRARAAWERLTGELRRALAVRREDPADPAIWSGRPDIELCPVSGHGYHRVDYDCRGKGAPDAGHHP